MLETVNRLITVFFKFVPLRAGVDEAGSGFVAQAVGLSSVTGVAVALIRKARTIVWSGVGTAILVRRGLSMGRVIERMKAAMDQGPR